VSVGTVSASAIKATVPGVPNERSKQAPLHGLVALLNSHDLWSPSPELFQAVKLARRSGEKVDHEAGEIEQHPTAGTGAFTVVHSKSVAPQCAYDIVCHALKVASRLPTGDYKEISKLADAS